MNIFVCDDPGPGLLPVAANLRESDYRELLAASGGCPKLTVYRAWAASSHRWRIVLDGRPIGLFGVTPVPGVENVGIPWLVGTKDLERIKKTFVKECKRYVEEMLTEYKALTNFVDVRNDKSITWLEWCGFTFLAPAPYGCKGLPFRRFYMEKNNV